MRNHEDIKEVTLVPMTINYDKIYEGQMFPYELIGDESKRENFLKMLKSMLITSEKYGKIMVKYGKPIHLKDKILEYAQRKNIDPK
jgi:glycerol-3-phosphate O-acyltransferase